jgi:hypothetical protein
MTRGLAIVALVACLSGCFGYNKSAKRWAYAGNTVLILGGGGVIAADVLTKDSSSPMMPANTTEPQRDRYKEPISGGIIAGAVLVAAGVFGIIFNATRPNVKTSR